MQAKVTYNPPPLPEWLRAGGFSDDPHIIKEYKRVSDSMDNAAYMVYSAVASGEFRIAWWYARDGVRLQILHNSTRFDGLQLSYIWVRGGELIPTMHTNIERNANGEKKFRQEANIYGNVVNFA